ncbi:MAG: protein kinase domain-containing protein [Thermoguttaceae bacterium]
MNAPSKTCAECGAELPDDAVRGLCPRCLLQAGLGSQADPNATVADAGGARRRRTMPDVGERFGPYRIVRLLGRGGMGVVYEAEEQDTGRRVALKALGRQFDSPSDRARFLREGRLAASINHPNSVYVYGTEEIDGTPTIAMELVSGGTLQERVKNHGPMPIAVAVEAILDIIAGLEAAQAIGILHRDIKPGNCFEDTDGTIKIGDFGLSISTAARAETNITAEGTMVGTPAFCSPEQLRGEELSVRSDMYAVGATLFYLLTGRVPFEAHNIAQLTANVLEKPVPSPRAFRKEIPRGLASAIQRCLAKQPAERFKSYDDLRQALVHYGSTAATPATLSLRFLAGVVDGLVTGLTGWAIMWLWLGSPMGLFTIAYEHSSRMLIWMLGASSAVLLYYAVFEGLWGAAAGKALCRLRIVRPDKNPPGFLRALVRAVIYFMLPILPNLSFWIIYGGDIKAMLQSPMAIQQLIGFSFYLVLALLFCTARRRNGFAAVQDLLTKTRVISRAALEIRPMLAASETPPPAADAKPAVGPYQVLETLETGAGGQWLLGYDLRLLRKVWIHTMPLGAQPVAAALRNIGRVGRLRWLAGRRTAEENWDAFEAVSGEPLLRLIENRQPWSRVRFWLYDLAREISAAESDGTLPPVLALDRVWIAADGRAKLLDFPAPGLAAVVPREAGSAPAAPTSPETGSPQHFLGEVAVAALEGRADAAAAKTAGEAAVPLPLHARNFLKSLPQLSSADAVAAAIHPLLKRPIAVSRLRRATVVAGCIAFPLFIGISMIVGTTMLQGNYSGIMELSSLLQARQGNYLPGETSGAANRAEHAEKTVTDRQVAIFIASHYRATIANDAIWNSPIALALIKGEQRQFAEESVADHPAPTKEEIAAADAAVDPVVGPLLKMSMPHPLFIVTVTLAVYVCLPAWIAALVFRGGLVLRLAGVTFVRRDGRRASRLRVFWRALVAWSPLWLGLIGFTIIVCKPDNILVNGLPFVLNFALFFALAVLSVALPERGLPDRLAGTWPVLR